MKTEDMWLLLIAVAIAVVVILYNLDGKRRWIPQTLTVLIGGGIAFIIIAKMINLF